MVLEEDAKLSRREGDLVPLPSPPSANRTEGRRATASGPSSGPISPSELPKEASSENLSELPALVFDAASGCTATPTSGRVGPISW